MGKRFSLRSALFAMTVIGFALFLCNRFLFNQLKGEPSWFAAGENVYHYGDIDAAQRQTVKFSGKTNGLKRLR